MPVVRTVMIDTIPCVMITVLIISGNQEEDNIDIDIDRYKYIYQHRPNIDTIAMKEYLLSSLS